MKNNLILFLIFFFTLNTVNLSLARSKRESNILRWQEALKDVNYDPGPLTGNMNKKTKEALISFQHDHNLEPTGKPNRATWNKLNQVFAEKLRKKKAKELKNLP